MTEINDYNTLFNRDNSQDSDNDLYDDPLEFTDYPDEVIRRYQPNTTREYISYLEKFKDILNKTKVNDTKIITITMDILNKQKTAIPPEVYMEHKLSPTERDLIITSINSVGNCFTEKELEYFRPTELVFMKNVRSRERIQRNINQYYDQVRMEFNIIHNEYTEFLQTTNDNSSYVQTIMTEINEILMSIMGLTDDASSKQIVPYNATLPVDPEVIELKKYHDIFENIQQQCSISPMKISHVSDNMTNKDLISELNEHENDILVKLYQETKRTNYDPSNKMTILYNIISQYLEDLREEFIKTYRRYLPYAYEVKETTQTIETIKQIDILIDSIKELNVLDIEAPITEIYTEVFNKINEKERIPQEMKAFESQFTEIQEKCHVYPITLKLAINDPTNNLVITRLNEYESIILVNSMEELRCMGEDISTYMKDNIIDTNVNKYMNQLRQEFIQKEDGYITYLQSGKTDRTIQIRISQSIQIIKGLLKPFVPLKQEESTSINQSKQEESELITQKQINTQIQEIKKYKAKFRNILDKCQINIVKIVQTIDSLDKLDELNGYECDILIDSQQQITKTTTQLDKYRTVTDKVNVYYEPVNTEYQKVYTEYTTYIETHDVENIFDKVKYVDTIIFKIIDLIKMNTCVNSCELMRSLNDYLIKYDNLIKFSL